MTNTRLNEIMVAVKASGQDLNTFRDQVVAAGWAITTSQGLEPLGDQGKAFVFLTHNPDKIKAKAAVGIAPVVNI